MQKQPSEQAAFSSCEARKRGWPSSGKRKRKGAAAPDGLPPPSDPEGPGDANVAPGEGSTAQVTGNRGPVPVTSLKLTTQAGLRTLSAALVKRQGTLLKFPCASWGGHRLRLEHNLCRQCVPPHFPLSMTGRRGSEPGTAQPKWVIDRLVKVAWANEPKIQTPRGKTIMRKYIRE